MEEKKSVNILFVEDDPNLSMILRDYLEMVGYTVDHAPDGEKGVELFSQNNYQLVILDIMMPKKDGFTTAKEIREADSLIPIIFLTAKILKEDRIKGFQMGCDDFITKPFSTEELSLRIKAILKRCTIITEASTSSENRIVNIGKFTFDNANMILATDKSERVLTRKESGLLKLLYENKNNLLPREAAMESIWGENDYFIGRSMDVFIAKLRKYLKPDPEVKISNVHGIGFKLEIQEP